MNKLLILEDDDMQREILRESFRERGYAVQDYHSQLAAILRYPKQSFVYSVDI